MTNTATAQTIAIGSKVSHYRKNWSVATVTNIYAAPGYGCLHASLRFENGAVTVCALDCLCKERDA